MRSRSQIFMTFQDHLPLPYKVNDMIYDIVNDHMMPVCVKAGSLLLGVIFALEQLLMPPQMPHPKSSFGLCSPTPNLDDIILEQSLIYKSRPLDINWQSLSSQQKEKIILTEDSLVREQVNRWTLARVLLAKLPDISDTKT